MIALVFLISFLDFLAFSAVIPFLPLFFLDTPHSLFPPTTPIELRYILMGLLFATYPLAQVLAAPILGHFSDKIGRKQILLLSYFGNALGYLACAFGIATGSIGYLYLGNLVAGLTGVNISTVNALISDLSEDRRRSRLFGFFHLMLASGFALGPFISGHFISHTIPLFLACAGVSLLNLCLLFFFHPSRNTPLSILQFDFRELLSCRREVKILLASFFFLIFGWYFFIKTFQVFLIEEIQCTEPQVFSVISLYGFCSFLAQIVFVILLHKHIKTQKFFDLLMILLATSLFSLTFASTYYGVLCIVPLFSFAYAILIPSLTYLVSELSDPETHGKLMGLSQSTQALAKIVAPALAGLSLAFTPFTCVLFSSGFILISIGIFKFYKKNSVVAKRSSIS